MVGGVTPPPTHNVSDTRPFDSARQALQPLDVAALAAARDRHLQLTKPPGSLGALEDIGCRLAGIAGECPPPLPEPAVVAVFAGDHGVHAQGVSPWPQEVTAQMVANFRAGGAAINAIARGSDVGVVVVDVGVATDVPDVPGVSFDLSTAVSKRSQPVLLNGRVRPGTSDLSVGAAMTVDDAMRALDVGAEVAQGLVANGARCLLTGDMGIANTTPSAALIAAITGCSAAEATGRGTGIDDETLAHKTGLVEKAVRRLASDVEPLERLAELGGLEHAALAGFIVGGAAAGVPVIVDGVIALAALLAAESLAPGVSQRVVAGHRSVEPGASRALAHLGLEPVIDLGLRLGEGSGACLAQPLVAAAARVLRDMATFDSAGVSAK